MYAFAPPLANYRKRKAVCVDSAVHACVVRRCARHIGRRSRRESEDEGCEAFATLLSVASKVHLDLVDRATTVSGRLAHAIAEVGALRLRSRWRNTPLCDFLCRAVAGQQLSVRAAATIWGRVLARAGETPLSRFLQDTEPEVLRACGLSMAKAKACRSVCEAAQSGRLNADALRRVDHARRTTELTKIWGVGKWTADMAGIFYFADRDIWPEGDVTARKTLAKLIDRRRKTETTAAHFRPYRSYLALSMWAYADARPK